MSGDCLVGTRCPAIITPISQHSATDFQLSTLTVAVVCQEGRQRRHRLGRCQSCISERIHRRTSAQQAQTGHTMAKPANRGTGDRHVRLNFGLANAATRPRCFQQDPNRRMSQTHSNRIKLQTLFASGQTARLFSHDGTE